MAPWVSASFRICSCLRIQHICPQWQWRLRLWGGSSDPPVFPVGQVGLRRFLVEVFEDERVNAFFGKAERHFVDRGTSVAPITAAPRRCRSSDLLFHLAGQGMLGAAEEHIAWMPMESSSLTECWWAWSSAPGPRQSTAPASVNEDRILAASSWRICRMASRNGSDSISPTVPRSDDGHVSALEETLRMGS